ncbi:zinc ribbon domain-containing protein [Paenibacillus xylanilyticus]|uniref:zinc ribbon domain-containing protein n=1 Tax=Paenibacillus xylanilyticus TaxID=248903 RepID=UPI00399F328C
MEPVRIKLHSQPRGSELQSRVNGKQVIPIIRWFPSSQNCYACEHQDRKKGLHIREWSCPNCGVHQNRNVNASLNIRAEGLRLISLTVGIDQTSNGKKCGYRLADKPNRCLGYPPTEASLGSSQEALTSNVSYVFTK